VACTQATSLNPFASGRLAVSMSRLPPTIKGFTAAELYGSVEVSDSDSLLRNPEIPCIERSSLESQGEAPYEEPQESQELPSKGSELHFSGNCEPCIFFKRKQCVAGTECQYCHFPRHGNNLDTKAGKSSSKHDADGTGSTTGETESTKGTSNENDIVSL